MKNIFFLLLAVFPAGIMAQSPDIKTICFEANGRMTYEVSNCIPFSDIFFYSKISGGKCMGIYTADARGVVKEFFPKDKKPAMVVNTPVRNKRGIAGNGKVSPIGTPLFAINNFSAVKNANTAVLSWKGLAGAAGLSFVVSKSSDGVHFGKLSVLDFRQSFNTLLYKSIDNKIPDEAYYRIEVWQKNQLIYTTEILSVEMENHLALYPTVTSNSLSITTSADRKSSSYKIINSEGRVVSHGILAGEKNNVSVSSLSAGNYIFEIVAGNKRYFKKFIKI